MKKKCRHFERTARVYHDLVFAEEIGYNKANLERVEQNEGRHRNMQQGRTKRSEEELRLWKE